MALDFSVVNIGELNILDDPGYAASLSLPAIQNAGTSGNINDVRNTYTLTVTLPDSTAVATDVRLRAVLRQLDPTHGLLTITIKNTVGEERLRFMQFSVRGYGTSPSREGAVVTASLDAVIDQYWRAVDPIEETFIFDGNTTLAISVNSDLDVYPTYTIKPTEARVGSGWSYRRPVRVLWNSPTGGEHSLDVTGGGLNTGSLLTSNKISSRNSIAVYLDDVIERHWYPPDSATAQDDFGGTTTRLWISRRFAPTIPFTLRLPVTATDTEWAVADDADAPFAGIVLVDNEAIAYTHRVKGYIYGVSRGIYSTTAAPHATGATIRPYHSTGYVLYGPAASVPPALIDSRYENAVPPVFLQNGATNQTWAYERFADYNAPGSWTFRFRDGSLGYVAESTATANYDKEWNYPWDALGLTSGWTGFSAFSRRFAVPVQAVRATGRQVLQSSATSMPNYPVLSLSSDDGTWHAIVYRADSAPPTAPEEFEVIAEGLRPTSDNAIANNLTWAVQHGSAAQVDIAYMEVTFDERYTPLVQMGAEEPNYDLDVTLTNSTTQESISVNVPVMNVGDSVRVDSNEQTATYVEANWNQYRAVRRNASRPQFLKLAPGENSLAVTGPNLGGMEIKISYRPRYYA